MIGSAAAPPRTSSSGSPPPPSARAASDYQALLARKRKDEPSAAARGRRGTRRYLEDRVKAEQYGFDSQAVRPYFEYTRVQARACWTSPRACSASSTAACRTRRCGTRTWRPTTCSRGAGCWAASTWTCTRATDKYKHAAQFTLATRQGAARALPEGVLVCNFPKPGAEPALHAARRRGDVLPRVRPPAAPHLRRAHALGGRCPASRTEWDFVEAPSQMLEEWVLGRRGRCRRSRGTTRPDEPIPAELVERMRAADEFGKGLCVRQQMFYAAAQPASCTERDPTGLDTTALVARAAGAVHAVPARATARTSTLSLRPPGRVLGDLLHVHVVAGDREGPVHACSSEEGLLDPEPAQRYRRAVLEPGGSKRRGGAGEGLPRPRGFVRRLRPVARRRPAHELKRCTESCKDGGEAILAYCRTIPDPRIRATCWGLALGSEVACIGWCWFHVDGAVIFGEANFDAHHDRSEPSQGLAIPVVPAYKGRRSVQVGIVRLVINASTRHGRPMNHFSLAFVVIAASLRATGTHEIDTIHRFYRIMGTMRPTIANFTELFGTDSEAELDAILAVHYPTAVNPRSNERIVKSTQERLANRDHASEFLGCIRRLRPQLFSSGSIPKIETARTAPDDDSFTRIVAERVVAGSSLC